MTAKENLHLQVYFLREFWAQKKQGAMEQVSGEHPKIHGQIMNYLGCGGGKRNKLLTIPPNKLDAAG